jgi:flagellar biosynthesis/type III secretory pathway chaperone
MDIKDIINAQTNVLEELNILLDTEKEILIKDRASELTEILDKKKAIAQKISLLERKRQELYGEKKADELVEIGLLTKSSVDKLKKLTEDIKEKNEVNLILTRQSINYIRMITSALNPSQKIVTYGNNGKVL